MPEPGLDLSDGRPLSHLGQEEIGADVIRDGNDIYQARRAMGLTVRELAALLQLDGANATMHLREMERGVKPTSGPIRVAVEALRDGWRPGR